MASYNAVTREVARSSREKRMEGRGRVIEGNAESGKRFAREGGRSRGRGVSN